MAARLLRELTERRATLSVAESLTGGRISATLTSVPGASASFLGGIVSYSTHSKHLLLGVDADLLADRGAVDPQVAVAMARGARAALEADWAVAVTGVAGPEPQDGRSVGTVFVGFAAPDGREWSRELDLTGNRREIREQTVHNALASLLEALDWSPGNYAQKSMHVRDGRD
ncbi:CinA family protein [Spiractinospora alimapuensis]|nr:CinA family protein [Spiractinospora alimapuensis]